MQFRTHPFRGISQEDSGALFYCPQNLNTSNSIKLRSKIMDRDKSKARIEKIKELYPFDFGEAQARSVFEKTKLSDLLEG